MCLLMYKLIKYAILFLFIGVVLGCLYCCSPAKRLKRLVRKYPELLKTDTLTSVYELTFPEVRHDTAVYLDTNTTALERIIDTYRAAIDSVTRSNLRSRIHSYIVERPMLYDTLKIQLESGGLVKVFQQGRKLVHYLYEPAQTKTLTVPTAIINSYKDIPWRLPWYYSVVAFVCGFAIIFIIHIRSKKTETSK